MGHRYSSITAEKNPSKSSKRDGILPFVANSAHEVSLSAHDTQLAFSLVQRDITFVLKELYKPVVPRSDPTKPLLSLPLLISRALNAHVQPRVAVKASWIQNPGGWVIWWAQRVEAKRGTY